MDLDEYQHLARLTAIYPNQGENYLYPVLGLLGEAGEVAGHIKLVVRDHDGKIDEPARHDLCRELGDVLWYLSQAAYELGLSLDDVAKQNLAKLQVRQRAGTLAHDRRKAA
jgi:NTP pyrophosphatase (non-canonical NTP hydrolase)